jgi:cytochrome oxidase assembly protein ShyY1
MTRLGFWQLSRAHQKEVLEKRRLYLDQIAPVPIKSLPISLSPEEIASRHVRAQGHWLPAWTVYLDNRPHHSVPGFHVVMPLALNEGGYVLVNRGWLPRNPEHRLQISIYGTPTGEVDIEGRVFPHLSRLFEFKHAIINRTASKHASEANDIRQNLDIAKYRSETGLPLRNFIIEQTNDTHDGLQRDWPLPAQNIARHYGYAVQWFGMSIALGVLGIYYAARSSRGRTDAA